MMIRKKFFNIGLIFGGSFILLYLIFAIFEAAHYSHKLELKEYKNFFWVFQDSVKNYIDTNSCFTYQTKHDIYNHFIYKESYYIVVWEFNDLNNLDFSQIRLNKGLDFNLAKIKSGEVLNAGSNQEVVINYYAKFQKSLIVQVNFDANFNNIISGKNLIGYYGSVSKIALCNDKIEPQYILSCPNAEVPTLLLFYKKNKRFFLEMITSEKNMDPSLINVFKLDR